MSIPRPLLKWLSSLNLSTPLTPLKHRFRNGYLIAEILHRHYPKDVLLELHGYDTGTGERMRKANWERLERVFKRYDIKVPHMLCKDVAEGSVDGIKQLLTILFEHCSGAQLHMTTYEGSPVGESAAGDKVITVERSDKPEHDFSRVVLMKMIGNMVHMDETGLEFRRNAFIAEKVRGRLWDALERYPHLVRDSVWEESREQLRRVFKGSPPCDAGIVLEVLLPGLTKAEVESPVFIGTHHALIFLSNIFRSCLPRGETFKIFSSSREYASLMRLLSENTSRRIWYIIDVVEHFLWDVWDGERVRVWAGIKGQVTSYLPILTILSLLPDAKKHHGPDKQLTTLFLNETLTVLHTYKTAISVPNGWNALPAEALLELSSALLVASFLVDVGVEIDRDLLSIYCGGMMTADSALSRAIAAVISVGVSKGWERYEERAVLALGRCTNGTLRLLLCRVTPLLYSHPRLCTPFARALLRLPVSERRQLITQPTIYMDYGEPYLEVRELKTEGVGKQWWGWGVATGCTKILNTQENDEGYIGMNQQHVVNAYGLLELALTHAGMNISPDLQDCERSIERWDVLFSRLVERLLYSMGDPTCVDVASAVFLQFARKPGMEVVLERSIPGLLTVLAYTALTGKGKCRDGVVQLLNTLKGDSVPGIRDNARVQLQSVLEKWRDEFEWRKVAARGFVV
ncbi:hypothetical protein BC832DRAFT_360630 [Gaertneriomyces semiglobifer]|nr:hypothetical protein BC832DRAFT_360630 [Gaertneriomyces semiglobifer]